MPVGSAVKIKRGGSRQCFITAIAVILLLCCFAGCGSVHPRMLLEVVECDSEKILLRQAAQPGTLFSVWFLHSYDRAFFEEHYRVIGEDRIVLTHVTFKSPLNGQGFVSGTYRSKPDGSAELSDINEEFEKVIFRLGSPDLANHALLIDGNHLRLLDYADAGALLWIRVKSE